jgi:hypothetical protein
MLYYDTKVKPEYNQQKDALIANSNDPDKVKRQAVALKANITKSIFENESDEIKQAVELERERLYEKEIKEWQMAQEASGTEEQQQA